MVLCSSLLTWSLMCVSLEMPSVDPVSNLHWSGQTLWMAPGKKCIHCIRKCSTVNDHIMMLIVLCCNCVALALWALNEQRSHSVACAWRGGGRDWGLGKMVNVNVKYCHKNSYIYAIMLITKDDHLTAGAWATCATFQIQILTSSSKFTLVALHFPLVFSNLPRNHLKLQHTSYVHS